MQWQRRDSEASYIIFIATAASEGGYICRLRPDGIKSSRFVVSCKPSCSLLEAKALRTKRQIIVL